LTTSPCQRGLDEWRNIYNCERPHEALGLENADHALITPVTRSFPGHLPDIAYWPGDAVRKVDSDGFISFKNRSLRIGKLSAGSRSPCALPMPMASST